MKTVQKRKPMCGRIAALIAVVCMAAVLPSFADTTIANNITLTADTDWRGDGVVTVPEGVTVDLNGHTLWVSGLAGKGAFTSSVADPSTFDLTTADASKVSSPTIFPSSSSPANLFNNNYDRGQPTASDLNSKRIIVSNENLPIIVDYDFGAAMSVNSYKVYAGGYRGGTSNQNSGHQRTAKHWKFYGSNDEGDDKAWTPLDERTVTDWNDKTAPDCKQFTFFNGTAYRHYRMEILEPQELSNGFTELVQLEYGYVPNQVRIVPSQDGGFASASNTVSGTAKIVIAGGKLAANADLRGLGKVSVASGETLDLAGYYLRVHAIDGAARVTTSVTSTFLDLTSASEAAMRASATTNGVVKELVANNKYPVAQAFDNNNSTITYDTTSKLEINYDFGESTTIDGYRILFNYNGGSYPKAWTFDGSDDGASWTVLDAQTGQTFTLGSWKTYALGNAGAYRYYRLNVTATSGSNKLHISELEFGRVLRNSIYVDADGIAASDFSAIVLSGGASFALPEGDTLVLSGNLDLSGFKVDGTIDLNGNDLYVSGFSGNGTITDSTAFDLTDATASRVSTESTFLSTGPATAAFANYAAFNASSGHRVIARLDNATLPVCIDYNFGEPTLINAYRVFGNSEKTNKGVYSAPQRQPKSFSFWGSVDGTDWVMLDERKNETAWRFGEMRQYEFANTTAYTRYRIAFYECNGPDASTGESYVDFFKLEYGNIDAAGHLHVVVPLNNTVDNTSVVLSGNLRLMKEGYGAFVATKGSQAYSCGTEVVTGALKCGIGGDSKPFGADGNNIVVHSGAVMEMNGKKNLYNYGFTLDGGTLRNWGADVGGEPQLKRIWLTADSTLAVTNNAAIVGDDQSATTIYLNGHTLATWISPGKYLRFYNTTILDGTVDVKIGGYLVLAGTSGVTATNVDFKATSALYVANQFSVRDYEARFYSLGSNMGTAQMTVAGVFKPTVLSYYGCTMLAGSTMDLTVWPGSWPMTSAFGENGKTDLEFADSGEITVKLAGRTDLKALARSADPHLFTWPLEDGVPVRPGAEFVLDPVTASAGFKVKKDATGLRLIYGKGFMLIVR